ncbi:MAG: outer membrane protein transport protein [Myxococcota bacterium]|nr:outer membrane protein transport protein [Myxococcota bacterium]MDW8361983.1 outer membrane protein transport protein [Myxococcales bacterium]
MVIRLTKAHPLAYRLARTALTVGGALLASWGGAPSLARGQAMDGFGMGSRAAALAGAVSADVEDWSAHYYNPAGVARAGRLRLGLGWFGVLFDMHVDDASSPLDPVRGAVFGFVLPVCVGTVPLAVGLGAHLPDARISRSRALPRQRPRWEMYDNRPHRAYLAAHVAVEPVDDVRLGVGLGFLSTSRTSLDLRGRLDALNPSASRLEHAVTGDLGAVRYPQAGLQWDASRHLSLGVVYRHEYALDTSLLARARASITGVGEPIPGSLDLRTASVNAFVPRQLSVGVAFRPDDRWRIGMEVTWIDWSSYRSSIGSTDARLEIAVPPELRDLIRVPDEIPSTRPIPAGFRDRWVPRAGVEHVVATGGTWSLTARGGYLFESTPVPDQRGFSNLLDNDRHLFCAGLGLRTQALRPTIPGWTAIDFHVQMGFVPERVTRKDSLVDRVGDHRFGGRMLAGGLTAEVVFE